MMRRRGMLRAVVGGVAAFALALGGATAAVAADEPTGTITGTVTREADGEPVEGVGVFVSDTEGGFSFNGYSDANGEYAVGELPAGEYVVRFAPDGAPDLLSEYWNDASDWESAERIAVAGDETIPGVDASLQPAGMITGVVTRDSDGTPVEGVTVRLSAADGSSWNAGVASTQLDGSFVVGGLRDGDYVVRFDAPEGSGLIGEYWDDAVDSGSATPVSVVAGETDAGIDAVLSSGGAISGVVTRQVDGSAVEDAYVAALNANDEVVGSTRSQFDGGYRLDGLPEGDYVVRFGAPDTGELASEFWQDVHVRSAATPVSVSLLQTVENIDAALEPVGHISGTVTTEADGSAVSGFVSISPVDGGEDMQIVDIDSEGLYTADVAPGAYHVSFHSNVPELLWEYWEDAASLETATAVVVAAGEDVTGIDAQLASAAHIAGVVSLDSDETHEIRVEAWDEGEVVGMAYANSQTGAYSITLPAGTYIVKASATFYNSDATAKPQFFDGVDTAELATPVTTGAGETVDEIDFTLVTESDSGPEPKPALTLSADSIRAGKDLTVAGTGFEPGATIAFELHSDPIALGTLTADAGGVLKGSLRIPASAPAGKHTLVALAGSTVIASTAVTVTAATPGGPSTGGATTPGTGLASTGADAPVAVVAIGVLLAVLGGLLVRRRRVES